MSALNNAELHAKKKCSRCGKMQQNMKFYKDRNNERIDVCRDCLVKGIDVKKPSTFLPALELLDYPFIEGVWLDQCKKQYAKDPVRFDPKNVLGIYARSMKLTSAYSDLGWADSEEANRRYEEKMNAEDEAEVDRARRTEMARQAREQEIARRQAAKEAAAKAKEEKKEAERKAQEEWLAAEEAKVREARRQRQQEIMEKQAAEQTRQELMQAIKEGSDVSEDGSLHDGLVGRPMKVRAFVEEKEEKEKKKKQKEGPPRKRGRPRMTDEEKAEAKRKREEAKRAKESFEKGYVGASSTAPTNSGDMYTVLTDKQLVAEKAIVDKLTQDDVRQMTVKWGDTYRPSEWLRMEEMYQKYASEFELSIDREETLRQICKVSLKLDQAIDAGEYADSAKLSSMLDTLRKSAKFTEAQNKEDKNSFVNSIGQLVSEVERVGGIIPPFEVGVDYPQDKVDITLKDNQRYLYNLVKEEAGLGNLIESYIQKLDAAAEAEARNKNDGEEEDEDYTDLIQIQVEREAEEMFASFDKEDKDES